MRNIEGILNFKIFIDYQLSLFSYKLFITIQYLKVFGTINLNVFVVGHRPPSQQ